VHPVLCEHVGIRFHSSGTFAPTLACGRDVNAAARVTVRPDHFEPLPGIEIPGGHQLEVFRVSPIRMPQRAHKGRQGDPWRTLVFPVLRDLSVADVAVKLGIHPRSVKRIVAGESDPRSEHKRALRAMAAGLASEALRKWGVDPPSNVLACCYSYLEERKRKGSSWSCAICGSPLRSRRARYCADACRQRAYRERRRRVERHFAPELS